MYGIYNRCLKKNFFAKAEFKNFISEKEKILKKKIEKRKSKIFQKRGIGFLPKCFVGLGILFIFALLLIISILFLHSHRCRREMLAVFFMRVRARVREKAKKVVEVDGFRVDVAV